MTKIAQKIRNLFIKKEEEKKESDIAKQKAKQLMDYLENCIEKFDKPKLKKNGT